MAQQERTSTEQSQSQAQGIQSQQQTTGQPQQTDQQQQDEQARTPSRGQQQFLSRSQRMPNLFDQPELFFERLMPRGWLSPFGFESLRPSTEMRAPRVDVIDRDNDVLVRAEIPGVNKEDLEVSAVGDTVTIRGQSRHQEEQREGDYYRCEISQGTFSRTVSLPCAVDADQATARFENGMLELTLPKSEQAKRKSIPVQ